MEKIIDIVKKIGDEWEIIIGKTASTPITFEYGRLKSIKDSNETRISIRIIKNGKVSFVSVTDLADLKNLKQIITESLEFGTPATFSFPKIKESPNVETFDPDILNIKKEDITNKIETEMHKIKNYNPEIVVNAFFSTNFYNIELTNSAGGHFREKKTSLSFGIEGQKASPNDILEIYEGHSSGKNDLSYDKITQALIDKFKTGQDLTTLENKKIPIIFSEKASLTLLLPIIFGVNGKNIYKKTSPLASKLGKTLFDSKLSISDNGLKSYSSFSRKFDDEGVAKKNTPLIVKGVLKNFLFDLYTASKMNKKSTGSGAKGDFCSWQGKVSPNISPSQISIAPGNISKTDMIKNLKYGLLIDSLLGVGQSNIASGEFSNNVLLGYKIHNGEIVGRVKNVMIAGNTYECLKNIDALSSEIEWPKDKLAVPWIQLSNVNVTF